MKKLMFVPPVEVATEAKKGLAFRKRFGRGGTSVGLARGRQLAERKKVSARVILRMYSYFLRLYVDKRGKIYGNEEKPFNGYIAWLLWGGDSGASWASDMRKKIREQ